jgi:hypothetical protein
MPWVKANIELSFPEISRVVELEAQQKPQIDPYYPLAYQRRMEDMKEQARDKRKVQNKEVDNIDQNVQYLSNRDAVKRIREKQSASQVCIAPGEYEVKPYNMEILPTR